MKKSLLIRLSALLILLSGLGLKSEAQTLVYSQSFIGGSTPTTQCTAWTTYCSSLLSSYIYTGFTINGSLNSTGYTCTSPTVATAIATALRTGSTTTQTSDGHTWYVGTGCGSGCGGGGGAIVELAVDQGTCACGSIASVRPAINNTNWGGMGTTCSAGSQTLTVTFNYQAITYTGGSPRTLPLVCQNSGPVSINSLLTTSDPATGLTATWTVGTAALHGTVSGFPTSAPTGSSVTPTGSLTYTPAPGYTGIDSFIIKASDGSANAFCTIIVTVNPAPGGITGTQCVVAGGLTQQLSDPTPGGAWSSGSPSIATVSATGVVSGVAVGTAVISYAPPGSICPASTTVTVSALPAAIGGTPNVCVGYTTNLIEAGAGTWSSSNPTVASISSTGVVTGVSGGTAAITYTLPSTCMAATPFVVNVTPPAITGTPSACASGGTTVLSNSLGGGSWASSNTAIATVGLASGIVTGVTAGVCTITYTAPTGCTTTINVTINPLPAGITGSTNICAGSTATLTDATPGGTWTSSNSAQATIGIGTGLLTGVTAGSPTITYTVGATGCRVTVPVIVNPVPAAITGTTTACVGSTTTLTDAGGGTWSSSNTSVATVNTFTGVVTGIAPGTTSITYSLGTGCSASASVLVNPLPSVYSITGGGSFCAGGAGVHVGLSYANSGVNYVLYNTGTPVSLPIGGSNSGLDFGLQTSAGVYTVVATNSITGCSVNMTGTTGVTINALPTAHNVTGGGGYCVGTAGSNISLDASETGIKYQLYNGSTAVGPIVNGTGTALSFGSYTAPGTYTAIATDPITGCSQLQAGSTNINVLAVPLSIPVLGGGSYCAGGAGVHITLGSSEPGANYQLMRGSTPVGSSVPALGGPIDFGLVTTPGIYTVIGVNSAGCTANMPGSATVVINPLPSVNNVTGGGAYCAGAPGVHVGLSFSTPGIDYTLIYNSTANVATVHGSGSGLDFGAQTVPGVYTVMAINTTTLCNSMMNGNALINMNALPDNSFHVIGGGSFCLGEPGRDITSDGSEGSVNYQLFRGTTLIGTAIGGTGFSLDFGFQNIPGTYTIKATNSITGCSTPLTGNAIINVNPLPVLHTVTGGGNFCDGAAGVDIGLNGSNIGTLYQLNQGSTIIATLSGTGGILHFGLQNIAGSYTVLAMDSITGCSKLMLGTAVVGINPAPVAKTVTGGGSYCAGGVGYHIGLDGSASGIHYQLLNGSTASGAPLAGSGSALDFGVRTAGGVYTVVATDPLSGCSSLMTGSALININALPALQVLTGGGNYCAGGPGKDIGLFNSDLGVDYQLYRSGIPVGSPVSGVGGALSFGLDTFGVYTARATDAGTGCVSNMLGTITVNTVSPVAYTVTGGGGYCEGGTGVNVTQSGSTAGVSYQLVLGTGAVGAPVMGTGSAIGFGLQTASGVYTVLATDTTLGCVANMIGSAAVTVNPLPNPETVNGGGSFCAGTGGVPVGLVSSVSGVNYQLYSGTAAVGSPVMGTTGSPVSFGLQTAAGTYTVVATDATTTCSNLMSGSAIVTIKPTPALYPVNIENYGNYCAADSGLHISLPNSETGVNYQLFRGSTSIGSSVAGSGSSIDMGLQSVAGIYTVVANNPTSGCSSNMTGSVTVNIVPLPEVYSVTGGGNFCPGSAGVSVGLDGSEVGVSYQLYKDGSSLGTAGSLFGTGIALNFGDQPLAGNYTVIANSAITPCANTMFGNAVLAYEVLPAPVVTLQAYPGTGIGVWQVDSIKAYVTSGGPNPTFQWYINGHAIAGATNSTFTHHEFFNTDSVSCTVTGSGPCGGLSTSKGFVITLLGVGVKQVNASGAEVRLAPNPNKGVFSLSGSMGNTLDEEVAIEITNMLGQVVYSGKVKTSGGNIDTRIELSSSAANGMYLLNLQSASAHTVLHFVMEQ